MGGQYILPLGTDSAEGTEGQDGVCNRDDTNYKTRDLVEDDLDPGLVYGVDASNVFKNEISHILINIS